MRRPSPRPSSRSSTSVTAAALASVIAMTAFVLWTGTVHVETASACFGPACASPSEAGGSHHSLGLIDL